MPDSPAISGDSTIALKIFSNGSQIDAGWGVISVLIRRKINMIPYARIVLLDGDASQGDFPISDSEDFKPGAEIRIEAGYGNRTESLFEGIVVKHGLVIDEDNSSRLTVFK